MRFEGILKSWNEERGFGFLEPLQSGEDVFVHIKAFRAGVGRPQVGEALSFEVEVGPQGKKRAKNVEPIKAGRISRLPPRPQSEPRGASTLLAIPLFIVLYIALEILWQPPVFIFGIYLVVSLITFLVYAADKSAARNNNRRTPEATLHLLAFGGGWPGALLAQQFLRHKSKKAEFRQLFWTTVILNVVILVFSVSPVGQLVANEILLLARKYGTP